MEKQNNNKTNKDIIQSIITNASNVVASKKDNKPYSSTTLNELVDKTRLYNGHICVNPEGKINIKVDDDEQENAILGAEKEEKKSLSPFKSRLLKKHQKMQKTPLESGNFANEILRECEI